MWAEITTIRNGYDDHSYVDGYNDTSLTSRGVEMARVAAEALTADSKYLDGKPLIVRTSLKKRAVETASIIYDYISNSGVDCDVVLDPGLTELRQGKFDFGDMSHDDRINFLQSCWDDFESQRKSFNIDHRFGEFKVGENDSPIICAGESHREWSVDIASSLIRAIKDTQDGCNSIEVTHRGASFMISQLVKLANGEISPRYVEQYDTKFMKYCERHDYCVKSADLAISALSKFIDIRKENILSENHN